MPWFDDEAFWEAFYPHMFGEKRFAAAPGEIDQAVLLTGMTHVIGQRTALDLCCGPGRHSLALAQKGFHVTAVDRSAFLLAKARERTAGVAVELVQSDMRDFVRPAAFDLALSMFTSFGYFETREQDLGVLRNVRTSLKKGGVFLMDLLGAEILATKLTPTRWHELSDGEILIEHSQILPDWSRIRNQWLLVKGERVRRFEFDHNIYSGQELRGLLETAGFSDVQPFGSLDGTPYDSSAARLVVRAYAG